MFAAEQVLYVRCRTSIARPATLAHPASWFVEFNNNAAASSRFCMSSSRLIIGASLGLMCGSEQKAMRRKTYSSKADHCMQGELQ